jgi:hypothetical protein
MLIIETNLTLKELDENLKSITLPYEKLNTTQFTSSFKYKGKIDGNNFVIEDINVGYKDISNVIKGHFVLNTIGKVDMHIQIENAGADMMKALIYALGYPVIIIILILLFIYNSDMSLNIITLLSAFFLILLTKPKNTLQRNSAVIDKLKKDLFLI